MAQPTWTAFANWSNGAIFNNRYDWYQSQVQLDVPICWMRFGDAGGGLLDWSGNGRFGTAFGGWGYDASALVDIRPGYGSSFLFDGSSGRVDLPSFNVPASFSVEAWIKTSSVATAQYPVWSNRTGLGTCYFGVTGGSAFFYAGWSTTPIISGGTASNALWHHMVYTFDNPTTTGRLYLDGVLVATQNHGTSRGPGETSTSWIGHDGPNAEWWPGNIDEFALYGTVLSLSRIQSHYNAGLQNYESLTRHWLTIVESSWSRGRDQLRPLSPPAAGAGSITLDNAGREYSPGNTASPLYGYLTPGVLATVQATYGGSTTQRYTGIIDEVTQRPEIGVQQVILPMLGTLSKLRGSGEVKITTALYQNIRTDQAIGYILDAIGWPFDRNLDTGQTTLLFWWLDNADPFDALAELQYSEGPGAAIYEARDGSFVFESRNYRITQSRCTFTQATFADNGLEPFRQELQYDPGLRDIFNAATAEVKVRAIQALGVVWSITGPLTLGASEARQWKASLNDPVTAAVTPAAGTDYTVSAGSVASVALNQTSGQTIVITVTAGAGGATISGLQLRAQAVTVTNTIQVTSNVAATASKARYGTRTYPYRIRAEIAANVAQDFVDSVVNAYQNPRPTFVIPVPAITDATLTNALAREVSDRVSVSDGQLGISADLFIERIEEHELEGDITFFFGGEETGASVLYLVLDSATQGILDTNKLGF